MSTAGSCVAVLLACAALAVQVNGDIFNYDERSDEVTPVLSLVNTNVDEIQRMFGDLAENLGENAEEAIKLFRTKRGSHGGRRHKGGDKGGPLIFGRKMCCDFPQYLSDREQSKSCHAEFVQQNVSRSATREENQDTSKCFMECIAKKKGWAKEDGTINKEAVTSSMSASNANDDWQPLITQAQEKCFAELPTEAGESESKCRADSQQFMYCIFEHHFLNCPASSWRESEKCRAAEALIAAVASKRDKSTR
ncbi:general odorant-binding protein 67 [Neocloeon triangulifer]|uniref:general odorant-binding protein 67 n=1 Tax=Neocloeon triangulifer TaxID=2078957 RepID=UPI00286ECB1C|nr:general odorant-binding protein 67 [Neocloeon triangulifer]